MPLTVPAIAALIAGAATLTGPVGSFSNGSGVSFGVNGNTITASVAAQSNQQMTLFATGNTTQSSTGTTNASSMIFRGAGVASVGITNGSIVIDAPAGAPSPVNFSAGTTSGNLGSVVFSNANNVSFGLNGATITATATIATSLTNVNLSAGTTSQNLSAFVFSNANNVSFGLNGSTVTATATVATSLTNVNLSAGTTSQNLSAFVFSNSNGVSFGLNGSTITASVSAEVDTFWFPYNEGVNVIGQQGQATLHVIPMQAHLLKQFDRVMFPVHFSNATNSTGTVTLSMWMGFYTKNVSTLSLLHSSSSSQALTFSGNNNSSAQSGIKLFSVGWTTTLTEGQYYAAVVSRSTSGGANASISQALISQVNSNYSGLWNVASNRSNQWPLGLGVLSVSTAGIPSSIAFSNLDGTGSLAARPPSWFAISGTV